MNVKSWSRRLKQAVRKAKAGECPGKKLAAYVSGLTSVGIPLEAAFKQAERLDVLGVKNGR